MYTSDWQDYFNKDGTRRNRKEIAVGQESMIKTTDVVKTAKKSLQKKVVDKTKKKEYNY